MTARLPEPREPSDSLLGWGGVIALAVLAGIAVAVGALGVF